MGRSVGGTVGASVATATSAVGATVGTRVGGAVGGVVGGTVGGALGCGGADGRMRASSRWRGGGGVGGTMRRRGTGRGGTGGTGAWVGSGGWVGTGVGGGAAARADSSTITSAVTSGSAGAPPAEPIWISSNSSASAWMTNEPAERDCIATPRRTFDMGLERPARAMHASVSFLRFVRHHSGLCAHVRRQDQG